MSSLINIQGYLNTINAPWGQLFYKLIWNHLKYKEKRILDFGSGFGITADYLAANNYVTAVEPNQDMLAHRIHSHDYKQIIGSLEELKKFSDASFDVIICHNVLEYVENREEILTEFYRLLSNNGELSIVKHNNLGKVMQKAVFENNLELAKKLLSGENDVSANFGTINEYSDEDLANYIAEKFIFKNKYGVRIFFGLQRNEFKEEENWQERMFNLESRAEGIPAFRDIAFFHHILLAKNR